MRQFYLIYVNDSISQTSSDQFKNLPTMEEGRQFYLSWSHYLKLMRIENMEERHFYEIESAKNDWSLELLTIYKLFFLNSELALHLLADRSALRLKKIIIVWLWFFIIDCFDALFSLI